MARVIRHSRSVRPLQVILSLPRTPSLGPRLRASPHRCLFTANKRRFLLRPVALTVCPTFIRAPEHLIKLNDEAASVKLVLYRHGGNTKPFGERESNVLLSTVEIPNGQTTVLAKGTNDLLHQKLRRRGTSSHTDTLRTR